MSEYIVEVNDHPTIKQEGCNVRCDDLFIQHEEIVRCKDCRHSIADGNGCGVHADYVDTTPDGFCNHGERREE